MNTKLHAPFTVFVIDDDDDNRELTAMVLTSLGATVVTAGTYDDALACLDCESPDLILCDLSLGDRRGEDLLAEFRERGCHVDVWAVSGHDRAPAGFRGLLRKPFTMQTLTDLLQGQRKAVENGTP